MSKSETKLWWQLRKQLPQVRWTRIESRVNQGVGDVNGLYQGSEFWVELKVAKGNGSVAVSPHQISWNYARIMNLGRAFFLVTPLKQSNLFLFGGHQGRDLVRNGLRTEPLAVFHDPLDWKKVLHHLTKSSILIKKG